MAVRQADLELLISGYMREKEKGLKLYMIIPTAIARIIYLLCPLLILKFGDFNKRQFKVDEDKTILKGMSKWEISRLWLFFKYWCNNSKK